MDHHSEFSSWTKSNEDLFIQQFPLHNACRNGDLESLSAILSAGIADFYEEDGFYGWSPLHWAAYFGKLPCLMKLIESGACFDAATERYNQTPAHIAAYGGKGHCLKWLLHCGALMNRQDYLGETPIHKAAKRGSMECVSLLISQGASLCLRNHNQRTPSQVAAENGFQDCANYIEHAAQMQQQSQNVEMLLPTMQSPFNVTNNFISKTGDHNHLSPYENGHLSNGFDAVDEMEVGEEIPTVGTKRGRDDNGVEESFKRMKKGALTETETSNHNVMSSYQAILAISTKPLKHQDNNGLNTSPDYCIFV